MENKTQLYANKIRRWKRRKQRRTSALLKSIQIGHVKEHTEHEAPLLNVENLRKFFIKFIENLLTYKTYSQQTTATFE